MKLITNMARKIPTVLPAHITRTQSSKYRVRYKKSSKFPVEYDKTFDTYDEACEANEQYLAKIALNVYTRKTKKDIGFSNFCDYVLEWYQNKPKQSSGNTLKFYRQYMNNLKIIFKNEKLRDITSYRIELALAKEKTRQKMGNGVKVGDTISENTLHHEFTVLRMIFNKAKKWRFIEDNPIDEVEEPTFKEKEIIVPEYSDIDRIEEIIMKAPIRERCQFLLSFFTGMREEEVCGLHLDDFDRAKKTVSIKRAIVQNDKTRKFEETKTKSQSSVREIPLPDRFFEILDLYLEYRKNFVNYLKQKTNGEYEEIPNLFLNKDGHFYRPARIGRKWGEFKVKYGLIITFHGLRHYYITNQMNYNDALAPRDVQKLAGHSNIKTTFKYVHPSQEKINNCATNLFNKFTKEQLYKNGKDIITIPISHIATIILGDPKYSKIEDLQITLSELSKKEVNFFNISEVMEDCKNYLQANYPSLIRIEKYKYGNKNEKEIMDNIQQEFGKEFKIQMNNEYNLEI